MTGKLRTCTYKSRRLAKKGSSTSMTIPRNYKSESLAAVHEVICGLCQGGAIDKRTMREFDEACLAPVTPLPPDQIKAIREAEHVSQSVFARYLNVSKNLVSDWERGKKRPGGPALRLLSIIERKGLEAVA